MADISNEYQITAGLSSEVPALTGNSAKQGSVVPATAWNTSRYHA